VAIIKFYGNLKQFGDKFRINADTAAEALNGLYCQVNGLKKHIMNGHFRVRINRHDINDDNLQFGLHSKIPQDAAIHIVPKIAGAKNGGIFSFIAGAAMIIVGVVAGVTTGVGFALVAAGVGLMLGGVAQMLTKLPKTDKSADGDTNKNTYFSDLDNTIAQGVPIPLCYGEMKIGSKVLSQGLSVLEDIENSDKNKEPEKPQLQPNRKGSKNG
jgi:predicted phage tail protein